MSLSSAAHAALHAHYRTSAPFPLLLRAGGDLSQKQSLKSGLKLTSLAKVLPVCLRAQSSSQRFIPMLMGALLMQLLLLKRLIPLECLLQAHATPCSFLASTYDDSPLATAALLKWRKARDVKCHTDATLADLRRFRIRCLPVSACPMLSPYMAIVSSSGMLGSHCTAPAEFSSWPRTLRQPRTGPYANSTSCVCLRRPSTVGSANWCSTAFGEQSHKDMKAQAAFTNGREEHMDMQLGLSTSVCSVFACCRANVRPSCLPCRCCDASSWRVLWRVSCSRWWRSKPGRGTAGPW